MSGMSAADKIKGAFLELKKENAFERISITDLCKQAGVSRTAFYRYYARTEDVLDDVIRDVLSQSEQFLEERNARLTGKTTREKQPICEYLRAHTEYKPIFSDAALIHIVLRAIVEHQKHTFIRQMNKTDTLSDSEAEILLYYQASGCLTAINRSYGLSDEQWKTIRERIDNSMSQTMRDAFDR